jgi:hypothetical protein
MIGSKNHTKYNFRGKIMCDKENCDKKESDCKNKILIAKAKELLEKLKGIFNKGDN